MQLGQPSKRYPVLASLAVIISVAFKGACRLLASLLLISAVVVVSAGATPLAAPITPAGSGEMQSTFVSAENGTTVSVRITVPAGMKKAATLLAVLQRLRLSLAGQVTGNP
jgi:hypothetical protein